MTYYKHHMTYYKNHMTHSNSHMTHKSHDSRGTRETSHVSPQINECVNHHRIGHYTLNVGSVVRVTQEHSMNKGTKRGGVIVTQWSSSVGSLHYL